MIEKTSINLKPGFTAPTSSNYTAKIGAVTNTAKRFYYLKDHLVSIRVTVNEVGEIVSYDDYDPWGMILTGRSSNEGFANDKYKFTGKERDVETGYDYFGARYYDSRIGRWLQVDPLAEKYFGWSPYNYSLNNPVTYFDPDGREIVDSKGNTVIITFNNDGTLAFSSNATKSIIRIANALNLTTTGQKMLNQLINSDIKISMNISSKTKPGRLGETKQYDAKLKDFGIYQRDDGTFGIRASSFTIFEGSVKEAIKEGSGKQHEGMGLEYAIGSVAGHEAVHASDPDQINKDIKWAQGKLKNLGRPGQEARAAEIEKQIIKESNLTK